jgi:hypothetical protein
MSSYRSHPNSHKEYVSRKAAGICVRCPAQAPEGQITCAACKQKIREAHMRERQRPPAKATEPRSCLRCDRSFPSEGPHNQLCKVCREFNEYNPTPERIYALPVIRG